MPWEHCGETLSDNTPACPACEVSKESWTIEWNATRTFSVSRRPILKVSVSDANDEPVPDEPFRVTLADGSIVEETVDELGGGKVPTGEHGTYAVEFPQRAEGEIVWLNDPAAEEDGAGSEDGAASEGTASEGEPSEGTADDDSGSGGDGQSSEDADAEASEDDAPPARFECATGRRQDFQIVATEFVIVPDDGVDVVGWEYRLTLPDGTVIEGTVDDSLKVKAPHDIDLGDVQLELTLGDDHFVHEAQADSEEPEGDGDAEADGSGGDEGDEGEGDDEFGGEADEPPDDDDTDDDEAYADDEDDDDDDDDGAYQDVESNDPEDDVEHAEEVSE